MQWIIKKYPEDFIVKENINLNLKGWEEKGEFLIFLVKRINMSHYEMLNKLSKFFGVPTKEISFCGIKDKKAVIYQYIAVRKKKVRRNIRDKLERIRIKEESIGNKIKISFVGYSDRDISSEDLLYNRFSIRVRNVGEMNTSEEEIEKIKNVVKRIRKEKFIPNYFDEQRFGWNNVQIGEAIIKRDFEFAVKKLNLEKIGDLRKLDKWNLKIYTHAFQSWLWNIVLKLFLEDYSREKVYIKINRKKFPVPVDVKRIKRNKLESFPMPGYGLKKYYGDIRYNYIKNVMDMYGLNEKDFIVRAFPIASCESIERSIFMHIEDLNFKIEKNEIENENNIVFNFSLLPGMYGTILIKSISSLVQSQFF